MNQTRSYEQIIRLPENDLRAIVASTNPKGAYSNEYIWAKEELRRRKRWDANRIVEGIRR